MKIKDWLPQATKTLEVEDIKTARLDSLVLLEFVLDVDRAQILAKPDLQIKPTKLAELNNLLKRRQNHEPIAYLRGFSEFYGREFKIDKNVLVPRPETEAFIGLLLTEVLPQFDPQKTVKVVDVGAGSGAIGITAYIEANKHQKTRVDMLELDQNAAKVAKSNVVMYATAQNVFVGPLERFDYSPYQVVLANLPYVSDEGQINQDATHEPRLAIFGGKTGLELYSEMLKSITLRPTRPLYLLLECLDAQIEDLKSICEDRGYIHVKTDLLVSIFKYNMAE